jgi:hypothetical protein
MGPAMPLVRALLLLIALLSPAMAESGPDTTARAGAAASQLQTYLDGVLKGGGRPDFSKPPVSDLLNQVFDLKQLEALPPAQGGDLQWLMDWANTANGAYKSIMFFGIAPPVTLQKDGPAIQRNITDYEDQEAAGGNFMLRIVPREFLAASAFMNELAPAQRTQVRMEGFNKMRVAHARLVLNYLGWIAAGMKPANARLISAALRDTGADWASAILPADRPAILAALENAEAMSTDEETRSNLSAFGALLAKAK